MSQAPTAYGSCWRKSRYKTEKRADKYARKFEKEYGDPMRAYYCGVCGGWHLTTVKTAL